MKTFVRLRRSSIVHLLFLTAVSFTMSLLYDIGQQPIIGDRAWFIYAAQVVYRNDPLYTSTTYGYTPYGPLLSSITMHIGEWFGVPTYLAPRFFSLFVQALNSCLLYFVARNASGKATIGLFSGLTLNGFGYASVLFASNLEPKLMVVCFMLVSMLALQHRHWFLVGLSAAIAAMFWHVAALILLVMICSLIFRRNRTLLSDGLRFSLGVFVGIVPAILYLTLRHQWNDFFILTVTRQLDLNAASMGRHPWRWIAYAANRFWPEMPVLALGAAGFAAFIIGLIRERGRRWQLFWDLRYGGMAPLTVAWSLFYSLDFETDDLLVSLPLIAFWATLFAYRIFRRFASRAIDRRLLFVSGRLRRRMVILVGFMFMSVILFMDAVFYSPILSLAEQRKFVERVLRSSEPGPIIAFGAEEFYVLREKPSPLRYLRFYSWTDRWIASSEPDGIDGFIARIKALSPSVVIIKKYRHANVPLPVVAQMERDLLTDFNREAIDVREQYPGLRHLLFNTPSSKYYIYTRRR